MLKAYVVACKLPRESVDKVMVLTRKQYVPCLWEPITDADTREEAEKIAKKINAMGGAVAYLRRYMDELSIQHITGSHIWF